ncbi:MAG: phage head morphogenesis protein [Muribaculaceae bacterium]|nr:phage head morphogenesis protein [Muribaculaceae bacterium]
MRSEHATLDNTTLPPSDEFWKFYLPPNGWNCRCTVEQVLRDDYPMSDPAVAKAAGDACTEEPKARMFRYNAGQEMTVLPKKYPYLPKGCGDCGGSLNLVYDTKARAVPRVPGCQRESTQGGGKTTL